MLGGIIIIRIRGIDGFGGLSWTCVVNIKLHRSSGKLSFGHSRFDNREGMPS
jgi:hypothetical protein